jgi:hypothetical protein
MERSSEPFQAFLDGSSADTQHFRRLELRRQRKTTYPEITHPTITSELKDEGAQAKADALACAPYDC